MSYQCEHCPKIFESVSEHANHFQWEHLKRIKKTCNKCNREFDITGFVIHEKYCKGVLEEKKVQEIQNTDNLCDYGCGKLAKYKLKSGKYCCTNTYNSCEAMKLKTSLTVKKSWQRDRKKRTFWSSHEPYNKGKTLNDLHGIKRANEIKDKLRNSLIGKCSGKCKDPILEQERKNKISRTAKKNGRSGGYRKKAGKGIKGWYKGYFCDSSWELAWVIYYLENSDRKFKKNTDRFEYFYKDEKHFYIPDFKYENGDYVEVKGFLNGQYYAKMKYFPKHLKIDVFIGKTEKMKKILDYVVLKYGSDFIKLYEKLED
jgi:hypothetical protein